MLVLGVMAILVALAAAFVTLAQMERTASLQRAHHSRARILARSGLEEACARLAAGQVPVYGGEDWDASGTLSGIELASEIFSPGTLDIETCPARHAMRPSYFTEDASSLGANGKPAPARLSADGRELGFSARLGSGLAYALKVEDESAKLNVNGGFLDAGDRDADGIPDHRDTRVRLNPSNPADTGLGWNYQLTRVLTLLGQQIGVAQLGTRTVTNRPPGGYRSLADLQVILGTAKDLSPWLTTRSWIDTRVIHPNCPVTDPWNDGVGSFRDIKVLRQALRLEEAGRPPVNLNTAPLPLLTAMIQDLQGVCWQYETWPVTFAIPPALAASMAAHLVASRPFATWGAFHDACDAMVGAGVIQGFDGGQQGGGNLCVADLLKANFDPNTATNKQLPDALAWRWIDKTDLNTWSTEGSLGPTGCFRISAAARVLGPDGRVLAECSQETALEAFDLLRQTSQKDFTAGRTGLDTYLSLSQDGLNPTAGASANASWWGGAPPGTGMAALTYPCPPTALPGNAADFDGAIALATYEMPPIPACRFLHHCDDAWDADLGATTSPLPHILSQALQPNLAGSVWPDPALPAPAGRPNTLYPDGLHAQNNCVPVFPAAGNLPPSWTTGVDPAPSNHAVFSVWSKGTAPIANPSTRWIACVVHSPAPNWAISHFAGIGATGELWGLLAENCQTTLGDTRRERLAYTTAPGAAGYGSALQPGLRWTLATAAFDTDQGVVGEDLQIEVTNALGPAGTAVHPAQQYPLPFDTTQGQDMAAGVLCMGGPQNAYGGPREVLDEFAVLDFTDSSLAAFAQAQALHSTRFALGRYYKRDDAAFLSGVVSPADGGPGRLLRAAWTVHLPADPALDILSQQQSVGPLGQPRFQDPRLIQGRVEVELLDTTATLASPALRPLAQGVPLSHPCQGFRYRVRFKPHPLDPLTGIHDPLNQPVLETPWFDDISFEWQSNKHPKYFAFNEL